MYIYNTEKKQKEKFIPLDPKEIKIYVCGPTVYNLIHIGNARPMIVFDTLRRYLMYKGNNVKYVSNFTDVDDKIINKAKEENVDASVIASRYIDECIVDMKALNIMPATIHPKATEEISNMIDMISILIDKGLAYEKNGTVYYRTREFKDYGKLSHKNLDDLRSGNRDILVSGKDEKEDSLDFVLWKPKKEGEPYWESPWGDGRPGWHIECSAMSRKYLGDTIDIHAGGEDLIFPHHENEIAQSEGTTGKLFSKYWMHNAFLNINNTKMSKSKGNFFTVRDITSKYDPMLLRFFMLSAHYRTPLNFSDELMASAFNGFDRILNTVDTLNHKISNSSSTNISSDENKIVEETSKFVTKFEESMDDDLNTADAISAIFELVRFVNSNIKDDHSKEFFELLKNKIVILCDVLGLIVDKAEDDLDSEIDDLIAKRNEARKNKDFALADKIRDDLLARGIELKDTREGVIWKRI